MSTANNSLPPLANVNPNPNSGSIPSPLSLSCQPLPPRYPYLNVFFPLKLFLLESKKVLKSGLTIPLAGELLFEPVGTAQPQPVSGGKNFIEFDPPAPCLSPDGFVSFRCRILRLCSEFDNKNFQLRISTGPIHGNQIPQPAPFTSKPITVIRAKLRITEQPPIAWYKDEGGRDKCISISAQLQDESGQLISNRDVPLRVSLCYEGADSSEVKNQGILKLASENPKIDRSGRVSIKFRIEEVSKNHQKQGFTVKIGPDYSSNAANFDIAPDVSNSIQVLSKRNKRRKKESSANAHSSNGGIPPMRRLQSDESTMGVPVTVNLALPVNSSGVAAGGIPFPSMINSVINWSQSAVKSFQSIEWQHVAFEVSEDGAINLHRPIFRCPSCWQYRDTLRQAGHASNCSLQRLLSQYSSSVSVHLQELAQIAADPSQNHRKRKLEEESDEEGNFDEENDNFNEENQNDEDAEEELDESDNSHSNANATSSGLANEKSRPPILPIPSLPAFNPSLFNQTSQFLPSLNSSNPLSIPIQNPQLLSEISFGFDGDDHHGSSNHLLPTLFSQSSIMGNGGANNSNSSIPSFLHFDEHLVYSIHLVSTDFGFPAFSSADELLGFYFEAPMGSSESIQFQSINQLPPMSDKIKELIQQFRLAKNSNAKRNENGGLGIGGSNSGAAVILNKSEFITIEKLKEQAILTHYAQQTGGFLS